MAAVSPSDIWAVGSGSPPEPPDGAHYTAASVEHWDGNVWSGINNSLPPAPPFGTDELAAVAAVPGATTNNVWVVGRYLGQPSAFVLVADQWNGAGWNNYTPPGGGQYSSLNAVAAISPTNIWAVGSDGQTLIDHFDGTAWSRVPSPNPTGSSSAVLSGIAASSASDVWAVGGSGTGGTSAHGLIEHWDGAAWSIITAPTLAGASNGLSGVTALSPYSAWAVGSWTDAVGHGETLIEQWDGTAWHVVNSPNANVGAQSNSLSAVSVISSNSIWAAGSSGAATLVEHWNGQRWTVVPSPNQPAPSDGSSLSAAIATSAANIWVGGGYTGPPLYPGTYPEGSNALFENLCIPPPTISGIGPPSGNSSGGTIVNITGTNLTYTTGVTFGTTPASSFSVESDSRVVAVAPAQPPGAIDVTVTTAAGSSAPGVSDVFTYVPDAVSWQQYRLVGSDGTTWKLIDPAALSLTLAPTLDSNAILSGNADLWTATVGVNQDLGIFVSGGSYGSGQLVGWKESGGYGGAFSPNAAFVQTMVPLKAGTTYTATLVWKANHPTAGTIFVAAGVDPAFSPTRLTAQLAVASDANLKTAVSTSQYALAGSDGSTWQEMDPSNLAIPFTPGASGSALVGVNADLWTQNAGVNQDLAISVSGGAFGSGQVAGWKESGGFAGTFSPNAAYAQAVVQLIAGTPYVIKVKWKANHPTAGVIRAGAGLGPTFSPTILMLRLFPAGAGLQDAASNQQYMKPGSTGADWTAVDSTNLQLTVTPSANALYVLSANVDLWTATAAVNQDIGIVVSGGVYGTGILVAWKESGGWAGTFSPNAAFVQTVIPLVATTTYTLTLAWKANHATTGTIFAGAGAGPLFSPTRITAQVTS